MLMPPKRNFILLHIKKIIEVFLMTFVITNFVWQDKRDGLKRKKPVLDERVYPRLGYVF